MDVVILADHTQREREREREENTDKYSGFAGELKKKCNMKGTEISIVVGVLGSVQEPGKEAR